MKNKSTKKAFTIAELLISVILASMIIGSIVLMIGSSFKSREATIAKVDVRDTVRYIASEISRVGRTAADASVVKSNSNYTLTIQLVTDAERDAKIAADSNAEVKTHMVYEFTPPKKGSVGGQLKLTSQVYSHGSSEDKEEIICDPSDISGLAKFDADVVTKPVVQSDGSTKNVPLMIRVNMSVKHARDKTKCIEIPMSVALRRNV